jgi:alkylated DNA repair dioxygenase AlkB
LHSDNERGLGNIIATISLGAPRKFKIKHNATKETKEFLVSNGTLIIMAGTMQRFWKHEILKTKEVVGERISLTFRQLAV